MFATRRPAACGSARVHRNAARGALVGVGLLVVTGAGTPVAVAATDTAPDIPPPPAAGPGTVVAPARSVNLAPPVLTDITEEGLMGDFGLGKTPAAKVVVTPEGPAPADLDRSGATVAFTGPVGDATCTTDAAGACAVSVATGDTVTTGSSLRLPAGPYIVLQTSASPGLAAAQGKWWVLFLCQPDDPNCTPGGGVGTLPNTSLFRQHLSAKVVSAGAPDGTGSGDPVAGASYALTGPDYPRTPAVTVSSGRATSGADGVLTFDGWFRPGSWTVRSLTAPAGYVRGAPATIDIPSTLPRAEESSTAWGADLVLAPRGAGSGTEGSGATGSPSPRPDGAGAGSGTGTPQAGGGQPAAPAAPAGRPGSVPAPVPTTDVPAPAPPGGTPATQPPPEIASAPDVVSPRLAPASSSFVEVGVIGFGIIFVALVIIGVEVLRRRARYRG